MYGFDHGVWTFGGWLMMPLVWLGLLAEAYARRQISREEYLQKRELRQHITPSFRP